MGINSGKRSGGDHGDLLLLGLVGIGALVWFAFLTPQQRQAAFDLARSYVSTTKAGTKFATKPVLLLNEIDDIQTAERDCRVLSSLPQLGALCDIPAGEVVAFHKKLIAQFASSDAPCALTIMRGRQFEMMNRADWGLMLQIISGPPPHWFLMSFKLPIDRTGGVKVVGDGDPAQIVRDVCAAVTYYENTPNRRDTPLGPMRY